MALFDDAWMKQFGEIWNATDKLTGALEEIGFCSTIGYGLTGEASPRGVLVVENGRVTHAGAYNGENLNWDIRATEDQWRKWMSNPPGMMGLGTAFATGKIKFEVGDYGAMLKDPRMAKPFIETFAVMGDVETRAAA